jgi:hypothetical protein
MAKKTKGSSSRRSNKGGKVNHDDGDDDCSYGGDHPDGSETNDSQFGDGKGNRSVFSMGGGSDTIRHYDDDDNDYDNDNEEYDDMQLNDQIIQRGDPGDESIALRTSNRIQTIRDVIVCLSDVHSNQHEIYVRRCYKILSLYGSACGTVVYDMLASHLDDMIEGCLYGLQTKSSSSKQYAVCRLIEVISILLCNYHNDDGTYMDHWITSLQDVLRRIIMTTSRSTSVRMAALRAVSMTTYMAVTVTGMVMDNNNNNNNNNDDDDGSNSIVIESLLDLCELMATNHEFRNQVVPFSLRATSLDCWTLLASTLDDWTIAGQDDCFIGRGVAILVPLQQALEETKSEASELRTSAAECLSLIHEARINLGIIDDIPPVVVETNDVEVCHGYDYDNENIKLKGKASITNNATARRYLKGTWDNSKQETLMDEVKQRIVDLANESSHRISKKDKKEQRSNFREYMATLVDDESPELVIKFRNNNGHLELSSWKKIVPLNCLRNILQSGFQTHLLSNPAIQQLFDVQVGLHDNKYSGTMSQLEKRLLLSKNSETYKNADQDRRKKRDKRQNIKNHFLTADGDDL